MGLRGLYFPQIGEKINPGLRPTRLQDRSAKGRIRRGEHLPCARFPRSRRKYSDPVNHTQTEKLKEHEKERDFFCVVSDAFRVFARRSSIMLGSAWAFAGAMLVILVWLLTGPTFHFSDTWQLIINTGTTIVTFLMVFLIQNTQNRDAKAMHLKLDEVIRALKKARNELVDLEDLSDEELKRLEVQFKELRQKAERDGNQLSRHAKPAELR
jgi:low affinity Fe/Cu permease